MSVFLATLGQRPEAITMSLDILLSQQTFDEVVILHTDAKDSDIATALTAIRQIFRMDYVDLRVRYCELCHPDGTPLLDTDTSHNAYVYYRAVLRELKEYREQGIAMHLLVSGGRKAMSIYATLAASLLFGTEDTVSTIVTPKTLMEPGLFHAPPEMRHQVELIPLPLRPARILPDDLVEQNIDDLLDFQSPYDRFMASLTPAEQELTEHFRQHPHATNAELGASLNKSARTIENQLAGIYSKMYATFEIKGSRKRDTLRSLLARRI